MASLNAQGTAGDREVPPRAGIFLVEDDNLMSLMLEDALDAFGCTVIKASNIADGTDLAGSVDVGLAVLDMNIAGRPVYPVAEVLRRRGIPFVFVTAYLDTQVPPEYAEVPLIKKPFRLADLERVVRATIEHQADGRS